MTRDKRSADPARLRKDVKCVACRDLDDVGVEAVGIGGTARQALSCAPLPVDEEADIVSAILHARARG